MSVIVAIQDSGVVYMGCDTQTTYGKDKENKTNEVTFKISKLSNGMLVGVCGKVVAHQNICMDESLFEFSGETLTKNEIVNAIIPKLKENLKFSKWEECDDDEMPISIILAYKDKLYMIYSDYNVIRITDYISNGAGSDYTFCSLMDESLSIRDRILNGLRMSAKRCSSVSNPYILIDTKNLKYEIVEE